MKVTFIGGGSAKFVSGLVRDMFSFESLHDVKICLMDINAERLIRPEKLVQKMIGDLHLPATVCSTTDQREAIYGADFVVITIMVGGFKHYESDGLIPLKYGVQPTVGDTVGPGAVMRMIRTGPSLVEIGRNVAELAPDAWIFNYSNPMAMATWMLLNQHDKTVGLCHSIQSEYVQLARFLNIPSDEVRYTAGGINHIDFYITLTHQGRDLYPQLLQRKEEILAKHPSLRVKFELLEAIGGWPAEGEMHQNEYYPWFNKNPAMAEEYAAEIMWGFHVDKKGNGERDQIADEQISGIRKIDYARSHEYGAYMFDSILTHTPRVIYGNVRNHGLIENLPTQAVVEVPCLVDARGVQPCRLGRIPMAQAAVMAPHCALHEMATEGVMARDVTLVRQAIQADPLTGAVLTLPQIRQMTDELLVENSDYMKGW